jgi:hypothetical protein
MASEILKGDEYQEEIPIDEVMNSLNFEEDEIDGIGLLRSRSNGSLRYSKSIG